MDQSDHNDNHFNGISVVVLEQVKQILHEGSNPVALAAAMIGVGSDLMRQSTSADYTLRLLNGVALELARISVKEAARGRNSIYQTNPAMGGIEYSNSRSSAT